MATTEKMLPGIMPGKGEKKLICSCMKIPHSHWLIVSRISTPHHFLRSIRAHSANDIRHTHWLAMIAGRMNRLSSAVI